MDDKRAVGNPHLYSIDNEFGWAESLKNQINKEDLDKIVSVSYSPTSETNYNDVKVWKYNNVPISDPDFIYLDGPSLTPERQITINPLEMENQLPKGAVIIIDNRVKTCQFLASNFKRKWKIKNDWLRGNKEFYLSK